ncbi:MAG: hypothetical protein ACOX9C_05685 [Kiritimatiellia bacterium]|jgi:hypothetical protein
MSGTDLQLSGGFLAIPGTNGVYSPDGSRILCERTIDGRSRIVLIENGVGRVVDTGPGNAAHPAWHPNGRGFVYTCGNETKTAWAAFQAKATSGYHLHYRPLDGEDRKITTGRFRDCMPSFSKDGGTVYFVSSRCAGEDAYDSSKTGIYSLPLEGGDIVPCRIADVDCRGFGQPVVSPDGHCIVWAEVAEFIDNWHLFIAPPVGSEARMLTPKEQSAYAPRWTPDGGEIVYTGFSVGDPGWCVYAIRPDGSGMRRICEGRNPDVHPDGTALLYDDGRYLRARRFDGACAGSRAPVEAAKRTFEKIAYVDSFDFAKEMETETAEGSRAIIDHVLKTGATSVLWRNGAGIQRYPSREESLPLKEAPLDKRRIATMRQVYGWLRYDDCGVDLIRAAADHCASLGVEFGIHLTVEDNHYGTWAISPWTFEHPQFWVRRKDDSPCYGGCSLVYPQVREHKLRIVEELLAYRPKKMYLDLCRCGWDGKWWYVEPAIGEWKAKYGCEPPDDSRDPQWTKFLSEYTYRYCKGLRERIDASDAKSEFVLGIEQVGATTDFNFAVRLTDWRRLVRDGIVDAIAVSSIAPDWNDPWGSTLRIYRSTVQEARSLKRDCKVYFPIMNYNFPQRPGYMEYAKRCGIGEAAAVRRLLDCASEAGGDGITMECVDYENYSPEVREVIAAYDSDVALRNPGV